MSCVITNAPHINYAIDSRTQSSALGASCFSFGPGCALFGALQWAHKHTPARRRRSPEFMIECANARARALGGRTRVYIILRRALARVSVCFANRFN